MRFCFDSVRPLDCKAGWLKRTVSKRYLILSDNLSDEKLFQLTRAMAVGSISAELAGLDINHFLLLIFDRHLQKVIVANDKFATNEILYYVKDKRCLLGDDVHLLASQIELIPKVNNLKAKEFLLFACLTPPETIYEEFFSIPAATLLEVDLSTGDVAFR